MNLLIGKAASHIPLFNKMQVTRVMALSKQADICTLQNNGNCSYWYLEVLDAFMHETLFSLSKHSQDFMARLSRSLVIKPSLGS